MHPLYVVHNRQIFVAPKDVAIPHAFHEEHNIETLFLVIKKCNNHEDYHWMERPMKQWWIDNMKYLALQLVDTAGNRVLCCNNGRTRSPMYLVSYLVIIYGKSVRAAMSTIGSLMKEQRDEELDRNESLVPILQHIYANDWVYNDNIVN